MSNEAHFLKLNRSFRGHPAAWEISAPFATSVMEFACGCQQMYYQWRRRCRKEMMNCVRWRFSHPIWSDVKCQRWYDKMLDVARERRRIFILMMRLCGHQHSALEIIHVCVPILMYIYTYAHAMYLWAWPRGLCIYFVGQWSVSKQLFVLGLCASTFLLERQKV